ncbi:MAG: putative lipid II flippase FtsW [Dehalococcoidia bacterium]
MQLRTQRPDYFLALVAALLTGVGLLAVYSASMAIGLSDFNNVNYFIVRQIAGAILGTGLLIFFARMDYHLLKQWSPLIMLAALIGLTVVLLPHLGVNSNGANRWIALGPLPPLEPSEFTKLAMVIYIAAWLSSKREAVKRFSLGVVPFVLIVGLIGGLIMLEPDFGTTLVIVLTTSTMFFIGGAALRHVATLVGSVVAAGFVMISAEGYRSSRFLSFLNPEQDPAGKGFHIIQLLIALGSGGIRGLGIGASRQKFFYVPGAHTDGIFAIVGEETGFIGAAFVILLFVLLVYRGLRASITARDEFGSLLAVGITCWIAYQAIINIGGITRSIPLTGIPLPLMSYGSSALMSVMAALGVLLSITRYRDEAGRVRLPEPSGGERRPNREIRSLPARRPLALAAQQRVVSPEERQHL